MYRLLCLAAALALTSAATVAAQEQQPPPAEVNKAIDRGVAFLKALQRADGTFHRADPNERGATPLGGWTLVECGVSPNDPTVRKAAQATRDFILTSNRTYDIALTILFLDRLGDPEDEPLIEALALQLMAGQHYSHGWTYTCPALPEKVLTRVRDHLAKVKDAGPRELPARPDGKPRDPKKVHPDIIALSNDVAREQLAPKQVDQVDHSNTQFAVLALWVARRHGLPVDIFLWRTEQRFRAIQNRNGGWGYMGPQKGDNSPPQPTAAMTACGMIALAVGNQAGPPKAPRIDLGTDPAVKNGLVVLSASIGEVGQPRDKLQLDSDTGGRSYYFLWTLERMAVIYNFKTIAGKDWYRWGAELLLANQKGDGSWEGNFREGGCDTCFALLFLKRVNVAKDLTILVGDKVKDPGKVPDKVLDLIGQEVEPGTGKKQPPKKNAPEQELPPPSPPGPQVDSAEHSSGGLCLSRRPTPVSRRMD
jgi:hypothetical protein